MLFYNKQTAIFCLKISLLKARLTLSIVQNKRWREVTNTIVNAILPRFEQNFHSKHDLHQSRSNRAKQMADLAYVKSDLNLPSF